MKKSIVPLLVLGLVAVMPRLAFAQFQSIARTTSTAVATLSGTGSVLFDIALKRVDNDNPATQVTWPDIQLPAQFVVADVYILLNSTITSSGGGIQIYTDNTAPDQAPYQYSGDLATTNPAGLIDETTTTAKLSLVWSVKADRGQPVPIAADPTNGGDPNSSQWLFFKDRLTPDIISQNTTHFQDGETFIAVKKGGSGIHFGQGDGDFGLAGPSNPIYFEADFRTALSPRTYTTQTLRLESYTQ